MIPRQKSFWIVFGVLLCLGLVAVIYETSNSDRTTQFVRSSFSYIKPPQIISFNINKPRTNLTRNITTISTKPTITSTEPVASAKPVASTEPPETSLPLINPKDLNESGFIPYTLGVSPLSDMTLIGNRIPEKIVIPVDISDIYFSVKTASFNSYRQQTVFLTWAQTVAMDQISFTTDSRTNWTDTFASHGYKINTAPHCGLGHTDYSLCCKSGVEYEQFYKTIEAGRNFSWLCHIDDDEYMNVWKLKRMLVKYDPSKPWYIGKSHHEYWKLEPHRSVHFPEAKRKIYKFNTGNVYCLSKQMMIEVEKYLRGRNFIKTCEKAHWIDDVTIAIVIVAVLGHEPTEERQMWSHYEVLDQLPKEESLKMINFGYGKLEFGFHGRWNTSLNLPNPRFSYNEDPTRFLSYHCMMYPKLKWCQ